MIDRINDPDDFGIPLLDQDNYGQWHHPMIFLLQSKKLLYVCNKRIALDASTPATNRWNKANFDAVTLITSKVNRQVFNTIVNADISDKASSIWNKINDLYASKRAMNKGRVWLNWQNSNYTDNLQQYINKTRKFHMHLDLVSMKVPPEIFSYFILGKLASNSNIAQIVDLLIVNNQLTEHCNQILLRLKEYVNLQSTKSNTSVSKSSKAA
ncbi:hypothetical protein O181_104059 [Austropuccinia psidii MF-1]|uniref:Retrotransposon Copia-like N-terminal domain-containing protein n=1 Tax=Austropuccinia psidii MF-1 TaxID=1389203 RepID=A0A9Q3JLP4_9BASI|nr:hypothetical protein [Austropuccinia psidii MF-1]